MCGRFVSYRNLEQLRRYFPIDRAVCDVTTNFNVAPDQEILAIVRQEGVNILNKFHWGLVPFWAKDLSIGNKMINARSETLTEKPSFRDSLKYRRCLIVADGFYEWTGQKGQRRPVFITLPDQAPFAFAGLWDAWHDKNHQDTPTYRSCTIITRSASDCLRNVHNRMPAVLPPNTYETWLDPENHDTNNLRNVLSNRTLTEFVFYPVSKQVNSVRVNDPANIKPIQMDH